MSATPNAIVPVELEYETERLLEELAERTGEKKADLLRNAIRNGMLDLEEYFNAVETVGRIERGEEKTLSVDEVRRELGLED